MTILTETGQLDLTFRLNGKSVSLTVATNCTLADVLRDRFGLKGTRIACGRSVCGACTVLLDGTPRAACSCFAFEVQGRSVLTVEGLADGDGELDPVQKAFAVKSAFQCGYCTSGMIMLVKALLLEQANPDRETVKEWVSSNICRCTGYQLILEAVELAVELSEYQTEGQS